MVEEKNEWQSGRQERREKSERVIESGVEVEMREKS